MSCAGRNPFQTSGRPLPLISKNLLLMLAISTFLNQQASPVITSCQWQFRSALESAIPWHRTPEPTPTNMGCISWHSKYCVTTKSLWILVSKHPTWIYNPPQQVITPHWSPTLRFSAPPDFSDDPRVTSISDCSAEVAEIQTRSSRVGSVLKRWMKQKGGGT